MAQTAVFIEMTDSSYTCLEILSYTPDEEDLKSLAEGNNLEGDITCEWCAYNVGEGESDTDSFLEEEDLRDLYETGNFEDELEKKFHLNAEVYMQDSASIYVEGE